MILGVSRQSDDSRTIRPQRIHLRKITRPWTTRKTRQIPLGGAGVQNPQRRRGCHPQQQSHGKRLRRQTLARSEDRRRDRRAQDAGDLLLPGARLRVEPPAGQNVPLYCLNITPQEELDKLSIPRETIFVFRDRGTGRPTKKERRELDGLMDEIYYDGDE